MTSRRTAAVLLLAASLTAGRAFAEPSVAQLWNEALLDAIRIDFPAPTVHARNLYHTSAAMYDAWAAFDGVAVGHFYGEKHASVDTQAAREEAISYAAYRVLSQRYALAVDPVASQARFDGLMDSLGYDKANTNTTGSSPAAIGNRIAQQVLSATLHDGSNEAAGYADTTGYAPANPAMVVDFPGVLTPPGGPGDIDPNRWQPLFIDSFTLQNDIPFGSNLQEYVSPHWGDVETFRLGRDDPAATTSWAAIDPGAPPQLGGAGDQAFRDNTVLLIEYSSRLDPSQGGGAEMINISPNTSGNRPLGTHTDRGYAVNPVTGQPYADNFVATADYGRVLAEYWADGPNSETPPGHWNVIANEISDHPLLEQRIGGVGEIVDDLEWDVKLYFALNGATHDAAVAGWGTKGVYDYSRPVTMIRYQGALGQSTDDTAANYHPDGLPLVGDLIEVVTAESIAPGGRHRNAYENANENALFEFISEEQMVGRIVVRSWNHEPDDPTTEVSGVDWILAENWVPYQDDNFVTPAFAAYVSGHSTFSRAAAEVLALFTGSEYFPGGLGERTFDSTFLDFEVGPRESITLQWATYFDAADEAGISRLWGGIHVPPDDFAGRVMGSSIGIEAYEYATLFFTGIPEPSSALLVGVATAIAAARQSSRPA